MTEWTKEDSRKLVEDVGLEWHEEVEDDREWWQKCSCGFSTTGGRDWRLHFPRNQLDPLSAADMDKTWKAFVELSRSQEIDFLAWLYRDVTDQFGRVALCNMKASVWSNASSLAAALKEYFAQRKGKEE